MCITTVNDVSFIKEIKIKQQLCKKHYLTTKFLNIMLGNNYLLNNNVFNDCQRRLINKETEI